MHAGRAPCSRDVISPYIIHKIYSRGTMDSCLLIISFLCKIVLDLFSSVLYIHSLCFDIDSTFGSSLIYFNAQYNYISNYQRFTQLHSSHFNLFKIFAETSLSQESRYKVESLHKMMQIFPFPPRIKLNDVTIPIVVPLFITFINLNFLYVDFSN